MTDFNVIYHCTDQCRDCRYQKVDGMGNTVCALPDMHSGGYLGYSQSAVERLTPETKTCGGHPRTGDCVTLRRTIIAF